MRENETGGAARARGGSILELVTRPQEGVRTVFELRDALLGDGEGGEGGETAPALVIERHALQPATPEERPRKESKPVAHTFYAVRGFIDYLQKFGTTTTVVFADPKNRVVQAVLEERAEKGKEVVALAPMTHPRWAPWRRMLGVKMDLEALLDLVRANRKAVTSPDPRFLIFSLSQVRCATEVELLVGSARPNQAAVNGLMVRTKIHGGGEDNSPVDLPESITIHAPIWVDQDPRDIDVDLILGAKRDGTEVWAQLASGDLLEAEVAAFDSLVEQLRQELSSEAFTVTHGTFGEGTWERVRDRG